MELYGAKARAVIVFKVPKMKKIDMHMHLRQGPMQNHLGTNSTFMM